MELRPWKYVRRIKEDQNPWWTYRHDEVQLPSGGDGEYHYVHVEGSSMAIPMLDDGRIILVRQYRYLRNRISLEFPCGSVKRSRTYDDTVREELAEETGYAASEFAVIGEFNPYNGVTDEMCRVYLAKGLTPAVADRDETEEFEIVLMTPQEVDRDIASGSIWDGMTLAAWLLARPHVTALRKEVSG